jgi:arginyl-tRNA synthetase
MRGVNTHLEFDLSIAREQSDKNPVFYLQYAYARICSILEKVAAEGKNIDFEKIDLTFLNEVAEINLIKQLMLFPETLQVAAEKAEPHIVCEYLREVAAAFHVFYHDCRIIGTDDEIKYARIFLANITKIVLKNGMSVLGVSSPEKM